MLGIKTIYPVIKNLIEKGFIEIKEDRIIDFTGNYEDYLLSQAAAS